LEVTSVTLTEGCCCSMERSTTPVYPVAPTIPAVHISVLSLGELEAGSSGFLAVLLPLFDPRVSCDEALFL
jgi:hypothetical protein